MKAQVDPTTVAEAAMGQPSGNPYTIPDSVMAVLYPKSGGKALKKAMNQIISHPPGRSRQALAMGPSQVKIAWLYMRNSIETIGTATAASTTAACWIRGSRRKRIQACRPMVSRCWRMRAGKLSGVDVEGAV